MILVGLLVLWFYDFLSYNIKIESGALFDYKNKETLHYTQNFSYVDSDFVKSIVIRFYACYYEI